MWLEIQCSVFGCSLDGFAWWHCSDEASMFKRLAAMIGTLPTESNHTRRSRRGCIVIILCVGVWTICVCVFLTLMYLRLSFTWSLRLGNQRSVFVWLFHVFLSMEEFIVSRTHRRLALHEMTLRISWSHGAFLCEAGFLLSAPVSYFIGSIFMSIDTRIFPICILFPSSFFAVVVSQSLMNGCCSLLTWRLCPDGFDYLRALSWWNVAVLSVKTNRVCVRARRTICTAVNSTYVLSVYRIHV